MHKKSLITALITPFKEDQIDFKGLELLIEKQIEGGVDGILFLGTTGESATLSEGERKELIRFAVDAVDRRVSVMIGCGTNSTLTTIERVKESEALGADMLLLAAPYYSRPTQEGMYAHFSAAASETALPICLYNIPKRTGVLIEVDTLVRLSKISNIFGVKDATGDLIAAQALRFCVPDFKIYCGDDLLLLPYLSIGGEGVISVASNLYPEQMKKALSGELSYYLKKLYPLFSALTLETNPIPIKAALNLLNLPAGSCRLPLTEACSSTKKVLEEVLNG